MNEWAAQHSAIAAALLEVAYSAALAGWADANGVRLSAGRTDCCRDNAVAAVMFTGKWSRGGGTDFRYHPQSLSST